MDLTLFIEGKSQEFADTLKRHSGWKFKVIADPLGAYQAFFHILSCPVYFLTSSDGRIRAIDKLAGLVLTTDTLESLMRSNEPTTPQRENKLIREQSVVVSDLEGRPITMSSKVGVLALRRESKRLVIDPILRRAFLVDSTGVAIRSFALEGTLQLSSTLSWLEADSVALLYDVDPSSPGGRIPILLDMHSGRMIRITLSRNAVRKTLGIPQLFANPATHQILGYLSPDSGLAPFQSTNPCMAIFERSGSLTKILPSPDSSLDSIACILAEAYMGSTPSGEMLLCIDPVPIVHVLDTSGRWTRRLLLSPGSDWRRAGLAISPDMTLADRVHLNQANSWITGIFPYQDGSGFGISFVNTDYPTNEHDPKSSRAIRSYYLRRFTSRGVPVDADDIRLPGLSKVYSLSQSIVAVSECSDDRLFLRWYGF